MNDPYAPTTGFEPAPSERPPQRTPWVIAGILLASACLCLLVILAAAGANLFGWLSSPQLSYAEIAGTAQATLGGAQPPTWTPLPTGASPPTVPFPTAWPSLTPESTPTQTPTPTPGEPGSWQRINPEAFIREYYSLINKRQYAKTFAMLSDGFKQRNHCCKPDGSFDEGPYKDWWNSIKKVEVLSASVKTREQNRALVEVELRYYRMDGRVVEDRHTFTLVGDPSGKSWLID
ncbi:MAG: hypothetical protein JXA78_14990 [Anaerolineales bacterium]|nr:hypothetical protein [Anaerolineales bacterium]